MPRSIDESASSNSYRAKGTTRYSIVVVSRPCPRHSPGPVADLARTAEPSGHVYRLHQFDKKALIDDTRAHYWHGCCICSTRGFRAPYP